MLVSLVVLGILKYVIKYLLKIAVTKVDVRDVNLLVHKCVFVKHNNKYISILRPIPYNPFQRTETEWTLPNSFYETKITLMLKPDKDRKTHTSYECRCKYPQQNICKSNTEELKKNYIQ